jgi:hypothetical protein
MKSYYVKRRPATTAPLDRLRARRRQAAPPAGRW